MQKLLLEKSTPNLTHPTVVYKFAAKLYSPDYVAIDQTAEDECNLIPNTTLIGN